MCCHPAITLSCLCVRNEATTGGQFTKLDRPTGLLFYQNIKKLKQVWAAGYIVVDWLFHSPPLRQLSGGILCWYRIQKTLLPSLILHFDHQTYRQQRKQDLTKRTHTHINSRDAWSYLSCATVYVFDVCFVQLFQDVCTQCWWFLGQTGTLPPSVLGICTAHEIMRGQAHVSLRFCELIILILWKFVLVLLEK